MKTQEELAGQALRRAREWAESTEFAVEPTSTVYPQVAPTCCTQGLKQWQRPVLSQARGLRDDWGPIDPINVAMRALEWTARGVVCREIGDFNFPSLATLACAGFRCFPFDLTAFTA